MNHKGRRNKWTKKSHVFDKQSTPRPKRKSSRIRNQTTKGIYYQNTFLKDDDEVFAETPNATLADMAEAAVSLVGDEISSTTSSTTLDEDISVTDPVEDGVFTATQEDTIAATPAIIQVNTPERVQGGEVIEDDDDIHSAVKEYVESLFEKVVEGMNSDEQKTEEDSLSISPKAQIVNKTSVLPPSVMVVNSDFVREIHFETVIGDDLVLTVAEDADNEVSNHSVETEHLVVESEDVLNYFVNYTF